MKWTVRARPLLVTLALWAAATVFFSASLIAHYIGENKPKSYLVYSNALHYAIWALLWPLIARVSARFPLAEGGHVRRFPARPLVALVLFAAVVAPIVTLTNLTILYNTYFPFKQWAPTLSVLIRNDFWNAVHDDFLTCALLLVAFQGWRVWRDLQLEQQRAEVLERQLAVARLDALRMQLHPHFLFNTLHTITGLIGEDPAIARRMVVALGDLLRRTLQEPSAPMQSLARELELIDLYMSIQRLRLGDRVGLDYDIDPAATTAELPHLLLQPLFENAVRHGAARLAGSCEIVFRAAREDGRVRLSLENDAPGKEDAQVKRGEGKAELRFAPARQGVGLTNTLARLKLHYGEDFTFEYVERPQGGVRVALSLPYHHAAEETRDVHEPAAARAGD